MLFESNHSMVEKGEGREEQCLQKRADFREKGFESGAPALRDWAPALLRKIVRGGKKSGRRIGFKRISYERRKKKSCATS